MSDFDAIVIGAGVNGLTAATVLARQGKRVCVLEAAGHLGGMAAADADGAPRLAHLLYNLSPLVREEIGLGAREWPFTMRALPTVSLATDGRHVVVDGARITYADGSAHPDAATYAALQARMVRYGALLRQMAEAPPPGIDGPLTSKPALRQMMRLGRLGLGLRRMGKPEMRLFLRLLLSNAYDMILDELPDGPLAGLMAADATRGTSNGPRAPGTVFSLIYRTGHGGQAALPVGGMGTVTNAFAVAARNAGCEIETGAVVTGITITEDRVSGVALENGRTITAPMVLTSSGAMEACQLAGVERFDIESTRRMRHVRAKGTAAKVNLRLSALPDIPGLASDLTGARFVVAPSADNVERAFNPSKYGEIPADPVIEAVIPSAADTVQGVDGTHFLSAIVQHVPFSPEGGWTRKKSDALARTVVDTLAAHMPDLAKLVTGTEVITPADIAAETRAPGGHWHHAEMSLDQILTLRPAAGIGRYALGPAGLYLCGAAAHPGGDIMGLAGLNAARMALSAEGGS